MIESLKVKLSASLDGVVAKNRDRFASYVGPRAVELLSDDALVTRIAEEIHPLLPLPIRMAVKPEGLAAFLLSHRGRLLVAMGGQEPGAPALPVGAGNH